MSTEIFIAVLGAALLHASWNALVKFGTDRLVAISLMAIFFRRHLTLRHFLCRFTLYQRAPLVASVSRFSHRVLSLSQ